MRYLIMVALSAVIIVLSGQSPVYAEKSTYCRLAYLVSDIHIPFWDIMWRGAKAKADDLNCTIDVYSADNSAKTELQNTVYVLKSGVDGIILSPTNSTAAVTVLNLAKQDQVPVVISDIGADEGDYVSFISSDNYNGAYQLGQLLTDALQERGWLNSSVGIVAIPQKRANGRARTAGFMKALNEAGIKSADIRQQVDFSYQETFDHTKDLIEKNPDIHAIWLQGSNRYKGALDAIRQTGREGEILLLTFDAEPEFPKLIQNGVLVGSGMQQPFLMGETAVDLMHKHLNGQSVESDVQLEVLAVSNHNIKKLMPVIDRSVLGLTDR